MTNFCGYDISPDMIRLSRVNMYLHGFANPRIHEYDTLTSQELWDECYDVILANPPFMTPKGGIRPHNRFNIKATRSMDKEFKKYYSTFFEVCLRPHL